MKLRKALTCRFGAAEQIIPQKSPDWVDTGLSASIGSTGDPGFVPRPPTDARGQIWKLQEQPGAERGKERDFAPLIEMTSLPVLFFVVVIDFIEA